MTTEFEVSASTAEFVCENYETKQLDMIARRRIKTETQSEMVGEFADNSGVIIYSLTNGDITTAQITAEPEKAIEILLERIHQLEGGTPSKNANNLEF